MTLKRFKVKKVAAGLLALTMSLTPLAVVGFAIGSLTLGSVATAGTLTNGGTATTADGDGAFVNVTTTVCGVANGLTGPLGIAIGFCVLVAGLIALQVASRDAIPMIARAAVGTALILGSSLAFAAILGTNACA